MTDELVRPSLHQLVGHLEPEFLALVEGHVLGGGLAALGGGHDRAAVIAHAVLHIEPHGHDLPRHEFTYRAVLHLRLLSLYEGRRHRPRFSSVAGTETVPA